MMKHDLYEKLAERILESIEKDGVAPWHKPWAVDVPKNISKRPYRGINVLLLSLSKYSSPFWLTYNQAQKLGGTVNKGEHGTQIVFWKFYRKEVEDDDGEKELRKFAVAKMYTVFNVEQCTLPENKIPKLAEAKENSAIDSAEAIVKGWDKCPIHHGGSRAFYSPNSDEITVPAMNTFDSSEAYYSTVFHEMAHATGHPDRLDRFDLKAIPSKEKYSKEELVAEITASFLRGVCGIDGAKEFDNSVSYLKSWASFIRENKEELVKAAGAAQKAADYILGTEFSEESEESE